MIRIVLIGDRETDRINLSSFLRAQKNFSIVGMGKDAFDAIKSTSLHPDYMIIDINNQDVDGPAIIPVIKRYSPGTGIILYTSNINDEYISRSISCGISSYVLKSDNHDELIRAVKINHEGGIYLSPLIAKKTFEIIPRLFEMAKLVERRCLQKSSEKKQEPLEMNLSKTELRIVYQVGKGRSNREIAECLFMAEGTIRNRISSILHKTGLQNRSALAVFAVNNRMTFPN